MNKIVVHRPGGFAQLRSALAARAAEVRADHWAPFARSADAPDALEALRAASWSAYAPAFEALLPPPAP